MFLVGLLSIAIFSLMLTTETGMCTLWNAHTGSLSLIPSTFVHFLWERLSPTIGATLVIFTRYVSHFHAHFRLPAVSLPLLSESLQVFGTYNIFAQPVREPDDIFYTNLVQDLWSSFARTGDPNPNLEDLTARGPAFASTLQLLKETGWVWPKYEDVSMQKASLDYPGVTTVVGLPDASNGRCSVITAGSGT